MMAGTAGKRNAERIAAVGTKKHPMIQVPTAPNRATRRAQARAFITTQFVRENAPAGAPKGAAKAHMRRELAKALKFQAPQPEEEQPKLLTRLASKLTQRKSGLVVPS
jgi:hypothetical protein